MTKLLTLKKMKNRLILFVILLATLMLSGCGLSNKHEHDLHYNYDSENHYLKCDCGETTDPEKHDYKWVDENNRETTRKECVTCGAVLNQDALYTDPIVLNLNSIYGNYIDGALMPLIPYEIRVDSGRLDYNEEFDIHLNLKVGRYYCGYIAEGPLYVKLEESPYYEVIGESEYITPDFSNHEDRDTLSLDFKFTVKATAPTKIIEQFKFKIKFTPHESFWEEAPFLSLGEDSFYCNTEEEYFFTISALNFMSDSQGIIMGAGSPRLYYDSINREYLSGAIKSYDDYVTRVFECITKDIPHLQMRPADAYNKNRCSYLSKNIIAAFYLEESFDSIYEKYSSEIQTDKKEAAKELIEILYSQGLINSDQYEEEVEYIDSNVLGTTSNYSIDYDEIIDPDLFKERIIKYVYDEYTDNNSDESNCPTGPDTNSANLYLKEYVVPVESDIDIAVYTTLNRNIEGYATIAEEGFERSSNINFIDDVIQFSLSYNGQNNRPKFVLEVCLSGDDIEFIIDVYGYVADGYIFLSKTSNDDAYLSYTIYQQQLQSDNIQRTDLDSLTSTELNASMPTNSILSIEEPDLTISGKFYWQDDNSTTPQVFPLQYCKIVLCERGSTEAEERELMVTYTNKNGEYSFNLKNDTSYAENGGYDLTVKVVPAGEYITVYRGDGSAYYDNYYLPDNISAGVYDNISKTYPMTDALGFGKALQIAQAAIIASKYYETMKGTNENVPSVSIKYPHNEERDTCFYRESEQTIFILQNEVNEPPKPNSYASWDVIMHEYGHFVSYREEIYDSPGGAHSMTMQMAEHYKQHYNSSFECKINCVYSNPHSTYSEDDCKYEGTALAWSEGFATCFSIVAQEYAIEKLFLSSNINTINNTEYNSYNGVNHDIDAYTGTSDNSEATVQAILYDIYNLDNEVHDDIELWHQTMWNIITGSEAKTFDEFDNFFRLNCTDAADLEKYNKLLSGHHLAPSNVWVTDGLTTYCPTFGWSWKDGSTIFFKDRTYRLNFYDSNRSLIATTEEFTCTNNSYKISESLWQTILDNGSSFYVSVTIYENNDPITDYEGEWKEFSLPIIEASVDTNMSNYLSTNDCYWYKFIAPETGEYEFKTMGSTDTVGEILDKPVVGQSVSGIRDYCDNNGEDINFALTKRMNAGEIVYIRVRGSNWSATGYYNFIISLIPHTHNYTYNYERYNSIMHTAYCECGSSITETHSWNVGLLQSTCKHCGYVTSKPIERDDVPIFDDVYAIVEDTDKHYFV